MTRTTITLNDQLFKKLNFLAEQENRSAPNLIETILMRYLEEDLYVDDFEMQEIEQDKGLQKSIRQGVADYKLKKGHWVK